MHAILYSWVWVWLVASRTCFDFPMMADSDTGLWNKFFWKLVLWSYFTAAERGNHSSGGDTMYSMSSGGDTNIALSVEEIQCIVCIVEGIQCIDFIVEGIKCIDCIVEEIQCVACIVEGIQCIACIVKEIQCVFLVVEKIQSVACLVEKIQCIAWEVEIQCIAQKKTFKPQAWREHLLKNLHTWDWTFKTQSTQLWSGSKTQTNSHSVPTFQ